MCTAYRLRPASRIGHGLYERVVGRIARPRGGIGPAVVGGCSRGQAPDAALAEIVVGTAALPLLFLVTLASARMDRSPPPIKRR